MADPPRLVNGRYVLDGLVLPRVTEVLSVISKPGLEAWKHKIGQDEARRVSQQATAFGTLVHRMCEDYNRGVDPVWAREHEQADTLRRFGEAYATWLQTSVSRTVHIEHFVYHRRHVYAGTADLVAVLRDGRKMLVDLKTSNSLDATYRLQTMAYALALEEMGEPVDGRLVVQMPSRRPGELYVTEYDDDVRDRKAWLACLRLWRWNDRRKDDWKASP